MADNKPPTNANSKEDVYQFLKTIETYSQSTSNATPNASGPGGSVQAADTRAVFEFLDQFSQTKPTAATPPSSTGTGATVATGKKIEGNRTEAKSVQAQEQSQQQPSLDRQPSQKQTSLTETIGAGWAWNNLLATATTAYKTASTVVDSSVKGALATVETVRANETTKKFEERVREYVNKEAIEKIGTDLKTLSLSTLTTVVNVVAPPIAEHEVVEVWLTHDMIGYVGLESIVYHAFMRIMEQVEGGDILVRKGSEVRRRDAVDEGRKDLNVCEGFAEAVGIAKANIEQTIKHHFIPHPTSTFFPPDHPPLSPLSPGAPPVTTCPVFMAIQPTKASPMPSLDGENKYLYYTVVLNDPTHHLNFYTFSQSLPISWLEVPYADNEWVEEKMIEAIRLAVTCVAQDYVWHRMKDDDAAAAKKDEEVVVNEAKEGD